MFSFSAWLPVCLLAHHLYFNKKNLLKGKSPLSLVHQYCLLQIQSSISVHGLDMVFSQWYAVLRDITLISDRYVHVSTELNFYSVKRIDMLARLSAEFTRETTFRLPSSTQIPTLKGRTVLPGASCTSMQTGDIFIYTSVYLCIFISGFENWLLSWNRLVKLAKYKISSNISLVLNSVIHSFINIYISHEAQKREQTVRRNNVSGCINRKTHIQKIREEMQQKNRLIGESAWTNTDGLN